MPLRGKHGHKRRSQTSPTYVSWNMMLARCYRPSSPSFKDYGARGITVCARWHDFSAFLEDLGPRPEGRSLDRIDFNGNYEPGNVQWSTRLHQNRHKRNVRRLEFAGHSLTLAEWSERIGVNRSTLSQRLHAYRWPVAKVLKEYTPCAH